VKDVKDVKDNQFDKAFAAEIPAMPYRKKRCVTPPGERTCELSGQLYRASRDVCPGKTKQPAASPPAQAATGYVRKRWRRSIFQPGSVCPHCGHVEQDLDEEE
jgi:hypothetical protein